ncbi:MAG: M1 family aminopeptidase [Gemmatimonadota bacterium]
MFRYEVEYRFRSASTWIYAGILFLLALWMFLATADAGAGANINSAERLARVSVLVGTFAMLVTAAIFGDAAVRDVQAGMDPLLFTSRLRKAEYLGGRYLASLAVNALVLLAIPLGLFAATMLARSPKTVGSFRFAAYLQSFTLLSLPNLVVAGAILFTIGMLVGQVIPVYLGAIGIVIGTIVGLNYPDAITIPILAQLADPSGLGTLHDLTRYWTESERNLRLMGFPAPMLWNRVVWLAFATVLPALLLRRFRFAHPDVEGGRRTARQGSVDPGPSRAEPVVCTVPRIAGSFELRTRVLQTLAVARTTFEDVTRARAFIVALLVAMGLTLLWGWNVGDTLFDTSVWPVTHLVAGEAVSGRNTPIIYLLITIYTGEMVWRDRDARLAEIADAAPVPEGALLAGRLLALVAIIAAFQAVYLTAGVLIQTLQGYYHLELGLYLKILFGLNLANYVLFAVLALTIHVLVNHKYLGHIVALMAFGSTAALPALGLVQHHLLLYGTDPGWTYSDMNGFGPFVAPFVWFKLYWAAWALLLLVIAQLFWVRGREPGLRRRFAIAGARLGGSTARVAGLAIGLILALGGFIFYNTNVLNDYRRRPGVPQAEYEKRYKKFEGPPQPMIVSADLRIEIYPSEPAVDLAGSYRLVNQSDQAIDSVHLFTVEGIETRSVVFDRPSKLVLVDDELQYRIYALERPLAPGDSLQLSFDVAFRPRGFPNSRSQTDMVGNGAHFDRRWLPIIGYQSVFELTDEEARTRLGLAPRPPMPKPDAAGARGRREYLSDADRVQLKAVIGTAADQIAITPGVLRRSWTENGRRYFQYETEKPESFGGLMLSGRYAMLEDRWQDLPLRIFHHPAHAFNLDRMVRSMKASLEYYTVHFGPYPDSHLRIVEVPRYDQGGSAHPNTIVFSEDNFLTRVDGDEFDMAFFGTSHEVAHAWWGGQVRGATGVRGEGLHESLANYSAMMVTETTYGLEAARRVYAYQMDRYLSRRAEMGRDVPLLEVEDQPWIAYGKGAVAMYLLRDYIGAEAVNRALRGYLEKYRDAKPPYPTSLDLYAELRAVTPDSLQTLLSDLFEHVTLWEVEARRARVEPAGTGEYVVTLDVVAKKLRADSVGHETELPMDDLIEVGVFPAGSGAGLGEPLYLERRRIKGGAQTIRITVPREPGRAGIDPYHKLIDRHGEDNVVAVESAATAAPLDRQ